MSTSGLRGRWAQGLQPRNFTWVIRDRLGAGERPGGFARNHRKVRRQEELIWLGANGFTRVVSLLDSPHNLHAYEEAGLVSVHVPLGPHDELAARLDPTDARSLAAAPLPLARRAVRRWLTAEHPPDLATVDRVLAVARGEALATEVGGGLRVSRHQQQLVLSNGEQPSPRSE